MEKVNLKMKNVIFFDGVCHLCNGFVDSVISRDKQHRFLFAPLQGATAAELLASQDRERLDSVVYFQNGRTYYRSTAIVKVLTGLGGVYRLFGLAWLLPRPLRDFFYDIIARYRYSWFGKRDFCRIPLPEEKSYLLP